MGPSVELTCTTRTVGRCAVIHAAGEIDIYTAPQLREHVLQLIAGGCDHLVLDREAVRFLDSTALGVMVGILRRVATHDGSLSLVCTQETLLKIFRITGLANVFTIYPRVDAALSESAATPTAGRTAAAR